MGGAENLRLVVAATIVSVEKVSVPPILNIRSVNGKFEKEELTVNNWNPDLPLHVEKGPVPVPDSLAARIKHLLSVPYVDDGIRIGYSYRPTHRIALKEENHYLRILIMEATGDFEVYRDGKRIGGCGGDLRITRDLNSLLEKTAEAQQLPAKATASDVYWMAPDGGLTAYAGAMSEAEVEQLRAAIRAVVFPAKEGVIQKLLPPSLKPKAICFEDWHRVDDKGRMGGMVEDYWLNTSSVLRVSTAYYNVKGEHYNCQEWAEVIDQNRAYTEIPRVIKK